MRWEGIEGVGGVTIEVGVDTAGWAWSHLRWEGIEDVGVVTRRQEGVSGLGGRVC